MLPGLAQTIFGCWLLSFSYADPHCIENNLVSSGLEYFLAVHVACRFMRNCSLCLCCGGQT